ncbi:MAG TPA: TadE family protein [Planctomycetaceae bacterium]
MTRPPFAKGGLNRAGSRRAGAAAVEFAIVLPVLVTILLGATDFGRFSYSAIAVANAARAGAAFGSMNSSSSSYSTWQAGIENAVTDELSNSSAFDAASVTVDVTTVTEGTGLTRVSVQVTYPFTTIVSWSYLPSSFNLQHTCVMRCLR